MANKYVDTTATYNGDGTTSAQAGSDGAAGAWNDLIKCFKGTTNYAPAAGDTVYVRCPAGNTTITLTANCTFSSTPTVTANIDWIFDAGIVWSNNTGTIILKTDTGTSYVITLANYHNLYGTNKNFQFKSQHSGDAYSSFLTIVTNRISDIKIELPVVYSSRIGSINFSGNSSAHLINCLIIPGTSNSYWGPIKLGGAQGPGTVVNLENCIFDAAGCNPNLILFQFGSYNSRLSIYGGGILNSVETQKMFATGNWVLNLFAIGFDPGVMALTPTDGMHTADDFILMEIPNTTHGFSQITEAGEIHWRNGVNYPILNSILDNDITAPWSYLVYPRYAKPGLKLELPLLTKQFIESAATITVTANLLISTNYSAPKKNEWWIDVIYIDNSTGVSKCISSYEIKPEAGSSTLTTSTASWNTTAYGAINYNKYEISVTTPTSVKQNSLIQVKIISNRIAPSTSDFYFVDPEVVLA